MNCPHTINVAAYVLDALEPPEVERMREHLTECPDCRPEYDEFRGLPTLLGTLTIADVEDIVAPTELPRELCEALIARATVRRRKHVWNRLLGVAVAVTLLVASVIVGVVVTSPNSSTVSATDPHTHVHASITLTSRSWGTQIRLQLSGVGWAQQCMLVVGAADGRRDTAASWVANYQGAVDITGTTAIQAAQIRHLDIITTSGRRLVSVPPPAEPR
jgi:predicted anti-sigma-YlaC factor YlaD